MRQIICFLFFGLVLTSFIKKKDTRYFELRIYYCHPNRLEDLVKRFENHTIKLFEKHGMENIGYWLPTSDNNNALYYVLAYPNKAARDESWKAFSADPEWQKVARQSEKNGKIVAHVKSIGMNAAEISPAIEPSSLEVDRSFELRTYHCFPGKLDDLMIRFRDHTRKLFEEHEMQNIAYWTTADSTKGQPDLIYLLAYKTEEGGKKAWQEFRSDPKWIKVKADSEINGKIVDSVETVFLQPLKFSKIK